MAVSREYRQFIFGNGMLTTLTQAVKGLTEVGVLTEAEDTEIGRIFCRAILRLSDSVVTSELDNADKYLIRSVNELYNE